MTVNYIIQLLCEEIKSGNDNLDFQTKVNLPVSFTELQEIEAKLGCTLPSLLRSMYLEVGNGYFGEDFRLLSLQEFFIVHARKDRKYFKALGGDAVGFTYLVIQDWGCHIYSCIDLSNPPYPVLRYDAVGGLFIPEKSSFEEWVSAWMTGEDLWEAVMEEEKYNTFVNVLTTTQDLPAPLLLVLSEWIDELLIKKK